MITKQFIEQIKDRLSLSEIISRSVKLTRAGREHKGLCPFHNENTPSFHVNDDKQFYHCFGCGAHGDAVKFLMEHHNIPFREAVEQLAAEAGLQMPDFSPEEVKRQEERKTLYDAMDLAARWFHAQLFTNENMAALTYARNRGLHDDVLAQFGVGYAPLHGKILLDILKREGFSDQQLIDLALFKRSQKNGEIYPFFRERLVFPVFDLKGRVIAFGGRILPDNLRAPTQSAFIPPKYLNSSDTELFHKGRTLYNANLVKDQLRQDPDQAFLIVEGYTDAIACASAGISAVAPNGTALTDDQIMLAWRLLPDSKKNNIKSPILCFDGDNAGQRAAMRAAENILPLLESGRSAQFALMPRGEDPDSLIKTYGSAALSRIIQNAMPLPQLIWTTTFKDYPHQTPDQKAAFEARLMNYTAHIQDKNVQYQYRRFFKDKLWQNFSPKFQPKRKMSLTRPANVEMKALQPNNKVIAAEVEVLACLTKIPSLLENYEDEIFSVQWSSEDKMNFLSDLANDGGNWDKDKTKYKDIIEKIEAHPISIMRIKGEDIALRLNEIIRQALNVLTHEKIKSDLLDISNTCSQNPTDQNIDRFMAMGEQLREKKSF